MLFWGSGPLFRISVFPILDDTPTLTGYRKLRQQWVEQVTTGLGQSGHFDALLHTATHPDPGELYREAIRMGSGFAVIGVLQTNERGVTDLVFEFHDVVRGESWKELGFHHDVADERALQAEFHRWVNRLVERFTGVPGILGTRIVAVRRTDVGIKELYQFPFGTAVPVPLTFDRSLALLPAWTPDGNVAYTSFRTGYPKIFIGQDSSPFSARPGMNSGIKWSPDGSVAALTLSQDDNPELYLLDGKTGTILRRLTHHDRIDTSPTFSPDGNRIAFVSDRDGSPQIYVMDLQSGDVARLTQTGGYNTSPDWHPFAPYLVYNSQHTGGFRIHRIRVDTGQDRQLTDGPGDFESPVWSPDGRLILFTRESGRRQDLYVMNPDGSNQRTLTTDGGPYSTPAWERRRP
jgi:TolB protein